MPLKISPNMGSIVNRTTMDARKFTRTMSEHYMCPFPPQ
jgi:hypothetical protein